MAYLNKTGYYTN